MYATYMLAHSRYELPLLLVLFGMTIVISFNVQEDITEKFTQLLFPKASAINGVVTKFFTWSPDGSTELGPHTVTIHAVDDGGNEITKEITINVTEEVITFNEVPAVEQTDEDATLTWTTTGKGVAQIDYDISENQLRSTVDEVDSERKTDHSLTMSTLFPCTTYQYEVKVIGVTIEVADELRTLTTKGCPNDADVQGTATQDISFLDGGTTEIKDRIALNVPAEFTDSDATFQIQQLNRSVALQTLGKPSSELSPVTGLYQLNAFQDPDTKIEEFNKPIEVTVHYTPASDTDTSVLALYRHDGTSWNKMDDCSVDEEAQTVTCTTTHFSSVAGFSTGESSDEPDPQPTPTPTPTPQSNSSSGGGGGGGGSGGGGGGGGGGDSSSTTTVKSRPGKVTVQRLGKPSPVPAYVINSFIRRVLGPQFVTPDIHKYYIWRVQQRSNEPGYVKSAAHLEAIMNYWKIVNPTRPRGEVVTAITPATAKGRTSGVSVAELNGIMRRVLGPQFVTPDIHSYYVRRLTASPSSGEKITSLSQLEAVMNYWKLVRPTRPRGD